MSNNKTRCGFLGHPAAHTLSPVLHRLAYQELGLAWQYDFFDVTEDELEVFLSTMLAEGNWRGFSVSMPLKTKIVEFGEPDDLVTKLGVGNTLIINKSGPNQVYNTDVDGFVKAINHKLTQTTETTSQTSQAEGLAKFAIIGNGATAKSALTALATHFNPAEITIFARNVERGGLLCEFGQSLGVDSTVCHLDQIGKYAKTSKRVMRKSFDLIISTIPAEGANSIAEQVVGAGNIVFDCIYDPWPTHLMEVSAANQTPSISGLDLLVGQAIKQIQLMTGQTVDPAKLKQVGLNELANRATPIPGE